MTALIDRAEAGDLAAAGVLLLIALVVFVIEIGWFAATIAWMESRRERHRRIEQREPPADAISINAARHRRILDMEGL